MADIWMDVDTALSEVPVNIFPLTDDTDFRTRETAVNYNASGMDLVWNFVTTGGAYTQTAVTPTTSGAYDWAHQGDGMYSIEIPASGGASINNDTEGFGWFTGVATGVLPWRGPVIGFRASATNDAQIDGSFATAVQTVVNAALVALGLDHLLSASVAGADVTDNSIIARLVSKNATADWDTFNNTTDSHEAIRDNMSGGSDPWDTALPGSYAEGKAGEILGNLLAAIDNLFTDNTRAELDAVPAANAPWGAKINFIFMHLRNKLTNTIASGTSTLYADDGTTDIATSAYTSNGTTATKGEWTDTP